MTRRTWHIFGLLMALMAAGVAFGPGCDDEPSDGDADGDVDGDTDGDIDGDGDGDGDGDADARWTSEVVASDNVGRYSSIDVAGDGTVGVVYFGFDSYEEGQCAGDAERSQVHFPLYYSQLSPGGSWETEELADPIHLGAPEGVSFRFAPDGTPSVAMYGGEPVEVLCSANDAVFGRRDGSGRWSFEVAAANSGDVPVEDDPDTGCSAAASTAGPTVGAWPALAFDPDGNPAILYRDIHFGGMQRDDTMRADAELAYRRGGWDHLMVDCGAGGGLDNAAAFDSEGRLVALHRIGRDSQIENRHGLWAHRLQPDGSWLQLQLVTGQVETQERSLTVGPDGYVAVVYYDPGSQHAWVAELQDTTYFAYNDSWVQREIGAPTYNEGHRPAIALSPNGTLAVAYYRCARNGEETCDPDHDAVVFLWRTQSGSWTVPEVIDEGGAGECGTNLSLAFGPDGTAWVSYVCTRHLSEADFVAELKVARRSEPL